MTGRPSPPVLSDRHCPPVGGFPRLQRQLTCRMWRLPQEHLEQSRRGYAALAFSVTTRTWSFNTCMNPPLTLNRRPESLPRRS